MNGPSIFDLATALAEVDREIARYARAIDQLGAMHAATVDVERMALTLSMVESKIALSMGIDALSLALASLRYRQQWLNKTIRRSTEDTP